MFSGHIRHVGEIEARRDNRILVRSSSIDGTLELGSQVAIAGVRSSVARLVPGAFEVEISPETQRTSTLGDLADGTRVNLEAPVQYGEALQGHLVQGHVDCTGRVSAVETYGDGGKRVWIDVSDEVRAWLVERGSVSVDGVSLTIAELAGSAFAVVLLATTLHATTLAALRVDDRVNVEADILAKLTRDNDRRDRDVAHCIAPTAWSGVVTGASGVEKIVEQFRAGGAVLVWDPDRETEGDIIVSGAAIRAEHFTLILTGACCHPTVPCDKRVLERLEIPAMQGAGDHNGTWMYTPVDLAHEPGTGVSAAERAATVRRLASPDARPEDFVMPGHVFPLRARDGRLRERAGHTEATVTLCEAAGLPPVGVCCEVMNADGTMAGPADLERRALEWKLPLVDVRDLVRHL